MKIIKSRALTALAALTMTASHGVHAMPKGKALGAMSKDIISKTGFKAQPKKSLFELDGRSLAAVALAYEAHKKQAADGQKKQAFSEEEKSMEAEEFSDSKTPQEDFDNDSANIEKHAVMSEKPEIKKTKKDIMEGIKSLLGRNSFPINFENISPLITKLQRAVDDRYLSDNEIKNVSDAMRELENANDSYGEWRYTYLYNAMDNLSKAAQKWTLMPEIGFLILAIKASTKDLFSREAEATAKTMSKSVFLKSIEHSFRVFSGAALGLENLNPSDGKILAHVISCLKNYANLEERESAYCFLSSIINSLKGGTMDESLSAPADNLKKAAEVAFKRVGWDLGKRGGGDVSCDNL